jgi:hypothetical protein
MSNVSQTVTSNCFSSQNRAKLLSISRRIDFGRIDFGRIDFGRIIRYVHRIARSTFRRRQ